MILTFVGACAGSTAGGLKVSRVIILFKAARQDLNKMLHSHAVTTVRFEGKPLDEKTLRGVHNYFNIYMLLLTLSVLLALAGRVRSGDDVYIRRDLPEQRRSRP